MAIDIAGKKQSMQHMPGPLDVHGRNSDNALIKKKLGWTTYDSLYDGLQKPYVWIVDQVELRNSINV